MKFTVAALDSLPLPPAGTRATYHDTEGREAVKGLQLRVTPTGAKTFSVFARPVGGKAPERVTIGPYPKVTIEQARKAAKQILAKLGAGESVQEAKRAEKTAGITFGDALREYVAGKHRKDGLPLKERTKADYIAMVDKGTEGKRQPGALAALADKPLNAITAEHIRATHKAVQGARRAAYAAQVLRAVLNWHGTKIEDNPLSKETRGKARIQIPPPKASGKAIPPEKVGHWWNSIKDDYYRFILLTGCRPSEPSQIKIKDIDGGRIVLKDTKNRKDHTLILSHQAKEIVERVAKDKKPEDHLFPDYTYRKTKPFVKACGIPFSAKTLRTTFASIAEGLVSYSVLKKLMNHLSSGDVTGTHYVKISEQQLAAGWQAVADWIEEQAAVAAGANVVALPKSA